MMTGNGGSGVKVDSNETIERLRKENELLRADLEEARRLADFSKAGVEERYLREIERLKGEITGLKYAVGVVHIVYHERDSW